MAKAIIKLSYRQRIDDTAIGKFERTVFNQSFSEFAVKCQEYNPGSKYFSLAEMIANNPKANSLHYKTALAISGTIKDLNNAIPGLCNSLGTAGILFEKYQFEIIEGNPFNQATYKAAITYSTGYFHLLEIIDGYMLLAPADDISKQEQAFQQTSMLKMQPSLSITEYLHAG